MHIDDTRLDNALLVTLMTLSNQVITYHDILTIDLANKKEDPYSRCVRNSFTTYCELLNTWNGIVISCTLLDKELVDRAMRIAAKFLKNNEV